MDIFAQITKQGEEELSMLLLELHTLLDNENTAKLVDVYVNWQPHEISAITSHMNEDDEIVSVKHMEVEYILEAAKYFDENLEQCFNELEKAQYIHKLATEIGTTYNEIKSNSALVFKFYELYKLKQFRKTVAKFYQKLSNNKYKPDMDNIFLFSNRLRYLFSPAFINTLTDISANNDIGIDEYVAKCKKAKSEITI